jgi:hypothetical protein
MLFCQSRSSVNTALRTCFRDTDSLGTVVADVVAINGIPILENAF